MATHKLITIVGTSPESFARATQSAIEEAARTVRHLEWFEVKEMRGRISEGRVAQFQVKLEVGFRLEREG